MRGAKIALVILVAVGLFVFGCCGPVTPPGNQTGNQTGQAGGAAGGQTGGTTGGAAGGATGGTTGGETGGATGGQTGGTTTPANYEGKSYEELVALGVPLKCEVTSTYNGKATTSTLYMQGSTMMRVEIPTSDGETCTNMVMVMKNENAYIGCTSGSLFPSSGGASNPFAGCDWLMSSSSTTSGSASAGGYSAPDYSNVPSSEINCIPWVLDSSKFDTPGKICDMSQIMNNPGAYGGYQ